MRVLLDINILISNLLSPNASTSATGAVLQAAFSGRCTLLFVAGVVDELHSKLLKRSDLAKIPPAVAEQLVQEILDVAEPVPRLPEPYPEIGRDRKDDFLVTHAVLAAADYLVSWDQDLLHLGTVGHVKIVSPPAFLDALRAAELL